MNPTADPPLSQPQPPPHRPCDRHPEESFTTFCPSCLCERLAFLQPASTSSSSGKPPIAPSTTTAAAFKAIFKPPGGNGTRSSFLPELRRTKSFSASKNEGTNLGFEPQRKSCSLFSQEISDLGSSSIKTPTENDDVQIVEEEEQLKAMKDHMDLDSQTKKKTTFWSTASVFSKKLQQWRQKQKLKKPKNGDNGSVRLPLENPLGRRSCDIAPPRFSFDDSRFSFDEPRASWDGYLMGRTTTPFPKVPIATMVEDHPLTMDSINGESLPGGSAQTRDYYSDSRRRKSLDRSNSIRKTAAAVVAEIDELKSISTAKVSPAIVDSNSNSNSETFEISSFKDNASIIMNGDRTKKSKKWSTKAWNILGFIHRKNVNKNEDEDKYSRASGVERSYSYSESVSEPRLGFNPKLMRSSSSVSWRNSSRFGVESNGRLMFDTMSGGVGSGRRGESGKCRGNHAHPVPKRLY
ncbi:hypothetical protein Godav_020361 [Gossypium davidsonii]|uniref:Uncharacterized protein n=2 Tax=Gossypium TaxID=3633 RepID=A0A7J8R2P2_GOSDV|nr:hypothetical protein [Gossypium davidsonii]MBA0643127.1 hypothetical protein [Gossypium klotzschianum]